MPPVKTVVTYRIGEGLPVVKSFDKTPKGDKQAEKWMKELFGARKKDPWYTYLPELKNLNIKRDYTYNRKAKSLLQQQIADLQVRRQELLDVLGIDTEPGKVTVDITTEQ